MKLTNKKLKEFIKRKDELIETYKKKTQQKKYPRKEYEQKIGQRLRIAMQDLEPLIDKAAETIRFYRAETRGKKHKLTPAERAKVLILQKRVQFSNRNMAASTTLFTPIVNVDVSYKTIERNFSDKETELVLHNLHTLILHLKNINDSDTTGDGTGYSLTIKEHYASIAQKLKDEAKKNTKKIKKGKDKKSKFIYEFTLMDLKTRMYLAFGTSFKSENEAYLKAMEMAKDIGIKIASIRLDRYYSTQSRAKFLGEEFDCDIYLMPKKNSTIKGSKHWKKMLKLLIEDPMEFFRQYFMRNQSESGFSEDKKRMGWRIAQKRDDRICTAAFCTVLWHNLLWMGG